MEPAITFENITLENKEKIKELSAFATEIVKEHYDPIIGEEQNDYMLSLFQSQEGIASQLRHGYQYYLVYHKGEKAGFTAFYPRKGKLYLSKFYVHKDKRGKKIASHMFQFIKEQAKNAKLPAIFLNVNKENHASIEIYEHFGFEKAYEEKNHIGNGFYMDDFILEYKL